MNIIKKNTWLCILKDNDNFFIEEDGFAVVGFRLDKVFYIEDILKGVSVMNMEPTIKV